MKKYCVGILTLCFRKEALSKYRIAFDPRFTIIGDMLFVLSLSKFGKGFADQSCLACYRSHSNNLSKTKKLLQVKEMRIWFGQLKKKGEFNKNKLSALISLTHYQRAICMVNELKLKNYFKIAFSIKNFYLIMRFFVFTFYKLYLNKFFHKK